MNRLKHWITILAVALAVATPATAGDKAPVKPSDKDKCAVCGMFVTKYPGFTAQIIFKDGTYVVFDGVKDMFKYYFNLEKYNPSIKTMDIDSIYVTDYYELAWIDGYEAFYAVGSDVFGPMGKEIIAFAKKEGADQFMIDHIGKDLLKFGEITPDVIKSLD